MCFANYTQHDYRHETFVCCTDLCIGISAGPVGHWFRVVFGVFQGAFTYWDRQASVGRPHSAQKFKESMPPGKGMVVNNTVITGMYMNLHKHTYGHFINIT